MHYLIDGYNLFFRIISSKEEGDFTAQRKKLIEDLAKKIHLAHLQATVVFDSQFSPGPAERHFIHGLDICYTEEGVTADEHIIALLKKMPQPQMCTVVTSDSKLAWYARRKGAESQKIEEFIPFLNRLYKKKIKPVVEKEKKVLTYNKPPTQEEQYEAIFEERLKAEPPLPKPEVPGTKDKPRRKSTKPTISDYERWLKAFSEDEG